MAHAQQPSIRDRGTGAEVDPLGGSRADARAPGRHGRRAQERDDEVGAARDDGNAGGDAGRSLPDSAHGAEDLSRCDEGRELSRVHAEGGDRRLLPVVAGVLRGGQERGRHAGQHEGEVLGAGKEPARLLVEPWTIAEDPQRLGEEERRIRRLSATLRDDAGLLHTATVHPRHGGGQGRAVGAHGHERRTVAAHHHRLDRPRPRGAQLRNGPFKAGDPRPGVCLVPERVGMRDERERRLGPGRDPTAAIEKPGFELRGAYVDGEDHQAVSCRSMTR